MNKNAYVVTFFNLHKRNFFFTQSQHRYTFIDTLHIQYHIQHFNEWYIKWPYMCCMYWLIIRKKNKYDQSCTHIIKLKMMKKKILYIQFQKCFCFYLYLMYKLAINTILLCTVGNLEVHTQWKYFQSVINKPQ